MRIRDEIHNSLPSWGGRSTGELVLHPRQLSGAPVWLQEHCWVPESQAWTSGAGHRSTPFSAYPCVISRHEKGPPPRPLAHPTLPDLASTTITLLQASHTFSLFGSTTPSHPPHSLLPQLSRTLAHPASFPSSPLLPAPHAAATGTSWLSLTNPRTFACARPSPQCSFASWPGQHLLSSFTQMLLKLTPRHHYMCL